MNFAGKFGENKQPIEAFSLEHIVSWKWTEAKEADKDKKATEASITIKMINNEEHVYKGDEATNVFNFLSRSITTSITTPPLRTTLRETMKADRAKAAAQLAEQDKKDLMQGTGKRTPGGGIGTGTL